MAYVQEVFCMVGIKQKSATMPLLETAYAQEMSQTTNKYTLNIEWNHDSSDEEQDQE